jgi:anaerobic dimethyl sulfoxide reductase subunit A
MTIYCLRGKKMAIDSLLTEKITRRSVLKSGAAALAAAVLYGCSTSPESDESTGSPLGEYIVPQNDPNYGKDVEVKFNTGPYNCGARCLHKFHVKNGRVLRMTSDGDRPRIGSAESDECPGHTAGQPMQKRACVRGYGYIQHNYQPNRLKYPLFQTMKRGDLNGFKRVSWDWAENKIATEIYNAVQNRSRYGYLPLFSEYTGVVSQVLGSDPYNYVVNRHGNQSTGSVECAIVDTTGKNSMGNTKNDRFNSKFMIVWALDPSRTTYYQVDALWIHTKIKEAENVPIVFITSTLNDSASITGTGVTVPRDLNPGTSMPYTTTYKGITTPIDLPRWIACRPTTDGALTVAMMYVIYKNELYNKQFLKDKTFGFFPNGDPDYAPVVNANGYERVTRIGGNYPLTFPTNVTSNAAITGNYSQGDKYGNSVEYKVPIGASFIEYLNSLESIWGSSVNDYDGVLEYAAAVTGVKPQYIEALAMKYAEPYLTGTGAAMIDIGGGANRAYNGPEWVWLQICLTAMCGYTDKSGGSSAINMMASPDYFSIGVPDSLTATPSMVVDTYGKGFAIYALNYFHIPLTGTDGRTLEQLIADVKFQTAGQDGSGTPLDLTQTDYFKDTGKPLGLEVIGEVYVVGNNLNTNANINKNMLGLTHESVKFSYIQDGVMTPTAAHRDLVLPMTMHFENSNGFDNCIDSTAYFLKQNLCKPMYEARPQAEIVGRISAKILQKFGQGDGSYTPAPEPTMEDVKDSYEASGLTDIWSNKYGQAYKPSWEELEENGKIDVISPADNPIIGFKDVNKLGELYNTTGVINFFSPFWYIRMDMEIAPGVKRGAQFEKTGGPSGDYYGPGWKTATVKYVPVPGGYEEMFDNKNPKTGKYVGIKSTQSGATYKLIYMTNKSRNRAHTVFDSTAIIKDQFRQTAKMNPVTAAERGIKDGDIVYVYNDRGCMKVPAELTHQILPGYVSIEHGAWYRAHPTERVRIWYKNRLKTADGGYETAIVPVDVGGADNILTDDDCTLDTPFCTQTLAAQGGHCEVSKTLPDNRKA